MLLFSNSTLVGITAVASGVSDDESPLSSLELEVLNVDTSLSVLTDAHDVADLEEARTVYFDAQPLVLYSVALVATNAAGLEGSIVRRLMVDVVAPTNGIVHPCNQAASEVSIQANNDELELCFSGFTPPLSGIAAHRIQVSGPNATVLHSAVATLDRDRIVLRNVTLPCDATLTVTSQAVSGSGVAAPPITSTVIIDCSAPAAGSAWFGTEPQQPVCVAPATRVVAQWAGFLEPTSEITSYRYAIAGPDGSLVVPWDDVGLRDAVAVDTATFEAAPTAYHVQVQACSSIGLCSPNRTSTIPLLIVTEPPLLGNVTLLPFQTPRSADVEWALIADASSGFFPLEFDVCLGTVPFACQAAPPARTQNHSWHADGLPLSCGATYYATVKATNCAGLSHTVASRGVKLCCALPRAGTITLPWYVAEVDASFLPVTAEGKITIGFGGFVDECSGIESLSVVVLRDGTELTATVLGADATSYEITGLGMDGTYTISVVATSRAGTTASVDATLIVDTTPPTYSAQPVVVWEGGDVLHMGVDFCPPISAHIVHASWDAADTCSGIASVELAIVRDENVTDHSSAQWRSLGAQLRTRLEVTSLFDGSGIAYVVMRACNRAGACTTSPRSARAVRIAQEPSGGQVKMGDERRNATSSSVLLVGPSPQLVVSWSDFFASGCPEMCGQGNSLQRCFYDSTCPTGAGCNVGGHGSHCRSCGYGPEAPCPETAATVLSTALTYELRVGSTPFGSQVLAPEPVNSTSWRGNGLPLSCGATYYATVKATNCAGLSHTVASRGVKLCCALPRAGTITLPWYVAEVDASFLPVTAEGKITIGFGGFVDECSGIESLSVVVLRDGTELTATVLGADATSYEITGLGMDGTYTISVVATSRVGVQRAVQSTLIVNGSMPHAPLVELQRPQTAPVSLSCVSAADKSVVLSWSAPADQASLLVYSIASSNQSLDNAMAWTPLGFKTAFSVSLADLAASSSTFFIVRACTRHYACMNSTAFELRRVDTLPERGEIAIHAPPFLSSPASQLTVAWSKFASGTAADANVTLELCIGTSAYACQLHPFEPLHSTLPDVSVSNGSVGMLKNAARTDTLLPAACGEVYYATVRATNCAGLQTRVSSAGPHLCCKRPTAGKVILTEANASASISYVDQQSLRIQWNGYAESCSGIASYNVSVATGDASAIWSAVVPTGAATSLAFDADVLASLVDQTTYIITVRAIGLNGLSDASSASFTVDRSPPTSGTAHAGPGSHRSCISATEPLVLTWRGLDDPESGLASVEWAIGTTPGGEDLQAFRPAGGAAKVVPRVWNGAGLLSTGMQVYHTLRATNGAGGVRLATSEAVQIVPSECNTSYVCLTPPVPNASYEVQPGVHPLFLPLMLGMLGPELQYDAHGDAHFPAYGMHGHVRARFGVGLRVVDERESDAAQLWRMRILDESAMLDHHGARQLVSQSGLRHLMQHDVFYWRNASGHVLEVLHHRDERDDSVKYKKQFISNHQLPLQSERGTWEAVETDAIGTADHIYSVRRDRFRRLHVQRLSKWRPMLSQQHDVLRRTADTQAVVQEETGVLKYMKSSISILPNKDVLEAEVQFGGSDLLPDRPSTIEWSLRTVSNQTSGASARRRKLLGDDGDGVGQKELLSAHGYVTSALALRSEQPSWDEIKKARTRNLEREKTDAEKARSPCAMSTIREELAMIVDASVDKEPTAKAVVRVHDLVYECDDLHADRIIRAVDATLRSEACMHQAVRNCGGLFNLLQLFGTADAHHALAHQVRVAPLHHLPMAVNLAIHRIGPPEDVLLEALADRLHDRAPFVSGDAAEIRREELLMAAAVAVQNSRRRSKHVAVQNITRHVFNALSWSHQADKPFEGMHAQAHKDAHEHWQTFPQHTKEAWIVHQARLGRKALKWAHTHNALDAHEEKALEQLRFEHLRLNPKHSEAREVRHLRRVTAALRAAANLGRLPHAQMITPFLNHRSEKVSEAACDALRNFESGFVEAELVAFLRRQLEGDGHARAPSVTQRAVESLLTWKRVGSRMMSESVRLLLQLPARGNLTLGDPSCLKECARTCNPHWSHCRFVCESKCRAETHAVRSLAGLIKKGVEEGHSIEPLVMHHAPVHAHSSHLHPKNGRPGFTVFVNESNRHARRLGFWESFDFVRCSRSKSEAQHLRCSGRTFELTLCRKLCP